MLSLQPAGSPPVILASSSPARRALLTAAGLRFAVQPAAVDEAAVREALQAEGAAAADAAITLAELKALRAAASAPAEAIVLGADQILTLDDAWFDKPADLATARGQLQALAGQRHELWSAVVAVRNGARIWHHVGEARLTMRACSAGFLDAYLATVGAAALGSVGAYQIEGPGAQLFDRIEGDLFTVQGLPLLAVLEFLRVQGVLQA